MNSYRTSSYVSDIELSENTEDDKDDNLYENEGNSNITIDEVTSYLFIKSNSVLSAVLNICASTFGAGCLTYPHFVDKVGIINSLIIYIFVSICLYYSFDLLRSFAVDSEYYSFSVMTERVLGKKWLMVYALSSSIFYLSGIMGYMNVCYSIFRTLWSDVKDYRRYIFGLIYLFITYIIEIFLCLYTRITTRVHLFSIIVIIAFSVFVVIIVIGGIKECKTEKFEKERYFNPFDDNSTSNKIFFEFIYTSIMYIYGFSYHSTFPTFLGNVSTIATTSKKVNLISFGTICSAYMIISFFGYLYEDEVPDQLFLGDMNNSNDFLDIFLRVVVFIFLFTLIPHRYITIRDGYKCIIGKQKFTNIKDLVMIVICLFIANAMVFIDKEVVIEENKNFNFFSVFTNIFGGLLGVIIAFLLPAISYGAINGKTKPKAIIGYIISILFLVVGLLSVGYSINNEINGE